MPEIETMNAAEAVVRQYLTALGRGQVLDALNAFSMDARVRDASGQERRGIREIAAAFANEEPPITVNIEDLQKKGEVVAVRVRMSFRQGNEPRVYQSLFRVSRNRIRSLVTDRLPEPSSRNRASRTA